MTDNVKNVLGDNPSLTQSSYRSAVSAIIRSLQLRHGESDTDTADRIGVSAATVGNARNGKGNLCAVTLLRIGREYGLDAIAPAMHLIGAKAASSQAICTSDTDMPVAVAKCQLFIAEALSDNDQIDDSELMESGAAEAIERGGQVFDTLRWRLNSLRVRREQAVA